MEESIDGYDRFRSFPTKIVQTRDLRHKERLEDSAIRESVPHIVHILCEGQEMEHYHGNGS